MPKKSCCCAIKTKSCCRPELYENFITLFGTTMVTAAPVNPLDILVLRLNRPSVTTGGKWIFHPRTWTSCGSCNRS